MSTEKTQAEAERRLAVQERAEAEAARREDARARYRSGESLGDVSAALGVAYTTIVYWTRDLTRHSAVHVRAARWRRLMVWVAQMERASIALARLEARESDHNRDSTSLLAEMRLFDLRCDRLETRIASVLDDLTVELLQRDLLRRTKAALAKGGA